MSLYKRILFLICICLFSQSLFFAKANKTSSKSTKSFVFDFSNLAIVNSQDTTESFYFLGKLKVGEVKSDDWTKNVVYTSFNSGDENGVLVFSATMIGLIAETFASEENKEMIREMYMYKEWSAIK